jgi:hypothetical protein
MPTILIKKSDTPGSVPGTANLTNLAGGAEVAVNTADKRMYSMNSSSAVVELGTNPSSLTCADGSFTLLKAASASITNLTATSLVLSNLSIASANVTTLTSASATITNLLATSLTVSSGSTLNGGVVINEPGADADTRIEGDTDANLFFADASTDRIGIGTGSPSTKLHVVGGSNTEVRVVSSGDLTTSGASFLRFGGSNSGTSGYLGYGGTGNTYDIYNGLNGPLEFYTNASKKMVLDSSGNLGLGVTPDGNNLAKTIQLQDGFVLFGFSNTAYLSANAYYNSGWKYKNTAASGRYEIADSHKWFSAASGTAGNAITFTQAMTLDASGNLGVGTTSISARVHAVSAPGSVQIRWSDATNGTANLDTASGVSRVWTNVSLAFGAGAETFTERARITSGGLFLVGRTTSGGFAGVIEATQTGSGAVGSAVAAYATSASYGYYVLASFTTRSATSETSQYIAYSNDGNDVEFNLRGDGNGYADGTWNNNGADYAEYFESATGGALTVGATVVLDGNKVREATASDPVSAIIGVVRPKEPSKASMVVGNTAWNKWANKYLTDDFDRYIMEDHDVVEWTDADGKAHSYESQNIPDGVTVPADAVRKTHDDNGVKFQHYKLNPAWDKDAEYTPREKRDEWIIVGLVGQVKVLKGKPMNDRWIKMRDVSAAVEEWMIR